MKNFVEEGDVKTWTNSTGSNVVSGQVVKMSHILGIAVTDIADGATGAVRIRGVYTVPKVSAAVFAVGEKLLWDVSANSGAGAFDDAAATGASGDVMGAAVAWVAGANTETTCQVLLTPGNSTLTA